MKDSPSFDPSIAKFTQSIHKGTGHVNSYEIGAELAENSMQMCSAAIEINAQNG